MLELYNVYSGYGRLPVLFDVNFSIGPGEMVAILGPNGAGKSTLLAIVASLRQADTGAVHIAGQPLRPGDRALRRRVGIVPQELAENAAVVTVTAYALANLEKPFPR